MKLADIADRIIIEPRKLTHYALNPNSPEGRHKALLFERVLGYTAENYTELVYQLEAKSPQAEIRFHSKDVFGKRYTADNLIEVLEDRQATVRTG